ncbi:unnamed protein product [Trichogramma brassicae]|uniref:Uncharacterized protein n=1 Tax=Trichogramma brassicae TaxID=86971 RepID=A0A6H5ID35_9HYME|nr:unnamed protein product [Trichogramma brassicae]
MSENLAKGMAENRGFTLSWAKIKLEADRILQLSMAELTLTSAQETSKTLNKAGSSRCLGRWIDFQPFCPTPADRRRFSASLGSAPLLSRDSSGGPHYRRRCRRRAPAAPRYISRRAGPLRHSLVSSCAEHTSWTFRRSAALLPRVTKTQATCSLPGTPE